MHQFARSLNEVLEQETPHVFDMLSTILRIDFRDNPV